MIWIAIALVLLATVVAIAIPVLNAKPPRSATEEYDLAVFTDQMKELERDQARGLINAEEFKAARTEIGRRILAAQRAQDDKTAQKATGSRGNMIAAATVLLLIPLIAAPLYVWRGNPTLIGDRVTAQQPVPTTRPDPAQQAGLTESVKRLQERLEAAPDDFDGWVLLGRSYMVTQQPVLAIEAYAKAVTLRPEDAALQSYLGEAIVFSADGTVTEKARAAFVKAVEADPTDPAARFYLAMADAQAGNLRKALDAWIALAADTPADAPWRPVLNQQLRAAAKELNVDLAAVLPDAPPPLPPTSGRGGPSREDIEAAEEMSPADRQEMIRGMVAQLAARLEENPDDVEGWERLARSYRVLGEADKAADAAARAAQLRGGTAPPAPQAPPPRRDGPTAPVDTEDQQARIEGMVAGLAARLADDPADREGWIRLTRSYQVLNQPEKALEAFATATTQFPRDAELLQLYARAVLQQTAPDAPLSTRAFNLYRRVLELQNENPEALYFVGLGEAERDNPDEARRLWTALLTFLEPGSEAHSVVQDRLARLETP
ncbi:MAG: c-type cytochrome biogenesis protein CcmI [Alphaproteobacteria bacterium]